MTLNPSSTVARARTRAGSRPLRRTVKAVVAAGVFGALLVVPAAAYADVNSVKINAVTPIKAGDAINVTAQWQVTPGTMPTTVSMSFTSSGPVTAKFVKVKSLSANMTGCVVASAGTSVSCTWSGPAVGQRARISARLKTYPSTVGSTLTFPQSWSDASGASHPVGNPSPFSVTVHP